jgi:hypothetical protein
MNRREKVFVTSVTVASAIVGGFFGYVAELASRMDEIMSEQPFVPWVGASVGIISGIIVAFVWFKSMPNPGKEKAVSYISSGSTHGMVAGFASAVTLHLSLLFFWPHEALPRFIVVSIGLVCGIIAGGLLGCVSAAIYHAAVFRHQTS